MDVDMWMWKLHDPPPEDDDFEEQLDDVKRHDSQHPSAAPASQVRQALYLNSRRRGIRASGIQRQLNTALGANSLSRHTPFAGGSSAPGASATTAAGSTRSGPRLSRIVPLAEVLLLTEDQDPQAAQQHFTPYAQLREVNTCLACFVGDVRAVLSRTMDPDT